MQNSLHRETGVSYRSGDEHAALHVDFTWCNRGDFETSLSQRWFRITRQAQQKMRPGTSKNALPFLSPPQTAELTAIRMRFLVHLCCPLLILLLKFYPTAVEEREKESFSFPPLSPALPLHTLSPPTAAL